MKVIVLAAGGWHLGCIGAYGNDWVEAPNLDRLAAEGVVFDQHYADVPDAAAARRAWRSGRYDFPEAGEPDRPGPPAAADLLAALHADGVATCLIEDGSRYHGSDFALGWNHHITAPQAARGNKEAALEGVLGRVRDALHRLTPRERWLLWITADTLLPPWQMPGEYRDLYFGPDAEPEEDEEGGEAEPLTPLMDPAREVVAAANDRLFLRLQRTYGGAVTLLDEGVGVLLEGMEEHGLLDEAALVVTSDRGFALGEHGLVGDALDIPHEERVHVPLLVRLPGATGSGLRVAELTQAVDLMPTLLSAFGLPVPAVVQGHDLLPLCRGEGGPVRPYACCGLGSGGAVAWAIRTPDWALLLPAPAGPTLAAPPRLYVKPDDRWEVNDVLQHHLELAQHLEQTLRMFVRAAGQPGPVAYPALPAAIPESPPGAPRT
jgi:hypothetical protein